MTNPSQIAETVSLDYLRDMLSIRKRDFRDVTLPFGAVDFSVERKGEDKDAKTKVKVRLDDGRLYDFNDNGASQLSSKLGIPRLYLEKLPVDLAMDNIRHWQAERRQDSALWRLNERTGTVRAVLSERYADVPHEAVLDALTTNRYLAGYKVRGFEITDTQMSVRLSRPDAFDVDAVVEGDAYFPGVVVRNSDVGTRTLEIGAFMYVLVCTNGMIVAKAISTVKRRHIGQINVPNFVMGGVRKAIDSPYPAAIASLAPFSTKQLPVLQDDVDHAALNTLLAGKGLSKSFALDVANRVTNDHGGVKSGWNVVQAITKQSQTLTPDQREEADEAAGELAMVFLQSYNPQAYQKIAAQARRVHR